MVGLTLGLQFLQILSGVVALEEEIRIRQNFGEREIFKKECKKSWNKDVDIDIIITDMNERNVC